MAGTNPPNGASPPEHVAGTWYSVPELRLRDHYFSVPLNYSLDKLASPKISVFAREVVSGKSNLNLTLILLSIPFYGASSVVENFEFRSHVVTGIDHLQILFLFID